MEKKLYRSRRARVFGGVAGGLGAYFGLDPILVRVIFVVVTLMHGLGLLAYIIMWIVIPEEPFEVAYPFNNDSQPGSEGKINVDNGFAAVETKRSSGSIIVGVILIGIGLIFFADRIIPDFCFADFFPLVIIAIGAFLVWSSLKNRGVK
jgi:phage shock protein PspC (stress-responsive transcriptional regulator)